MTDCFGYISYGSWQATCKLSKYVGGSFCTLHGDSVCVGGGGEPKGR